MKLYLSSYKLGSRLERLQALLNDNHRAGIISNAGDMFGNEGRAPRVKAQADALAELGIEAEELDLRQYFDARTGDLRRIIGQYGLLWVMGGNSFVLRRAMQQSGLDSILPELIERESLVYGGFSAGAIMMTPTLVGVDLVDDASAVPDGYEPEPLWGGLGLYPRSIAPHFNSDHPESSAVDTMIAYFQKHKMPYIPLRDGQAIVVNGPSEELVG